MIRLTSTAQVFRPPSRMGTASLLARPCFNNTGLGAHTNSHGRLIIPHSRRAYSKVAKRARSGSHNTAATPRVAIVGAGPGGLTLGVLLQRCKIPFTIFEFRPRPTARELASPQGVLDLHEGSGLDAIRACGLQDDFMRLTGECAEVSIWANKQGETLFSDEDDKRHRDDGHNKLGSLEHGARPEISRSALNDLLIRNIPEQRIRWGYKLRSAAIVDGKNGNSTGKEVTDDYQHKLVQLTFDNNNNIIHDNESQQQHFDLVIGADGAWSKIRSNLLNTTAMPEYRDRQCITLTIPHVSARHPHLVRLVGPGSWLALGDFHAVISQRGPMDSARLYLMLTKPGEEDFPIRSGLARMTPSQAKQALLHDDGAIFGSWGEPVRELIAAACDTEQETLDGLEKEGDPRSSSSSKGSGSSNSGLLDIRPLYQLPDSVDPWPHHVCATAIGDAAHLTLPSGDGVNTSMLDALEVSKAIARAYQWHQGGEADGASFQKATRPLLAEFEEGMWLRAKKAREDADGLQQLMFGSVDSAETIAVLFGCGEMGKSRKPLAEQW